MHGDGAFTYDRADAGPAVAVLQTELGHRGEREHRIREFDLVAVVLLT